MATGDLNPFSLIQGFEYGQQRQREEEKALEDIQRASLLNELLGTRVGEFQGMQQTETRRIQDLLQQVNAQLGVDLGGIQSQALGAQRGEVLSGVEAGMAGRAAQARMGRDEAVFRERELAPLERTIRGSVAESDVAGLPETLRTRRGQTAVVAGTQQEQLAQLAAREAERAATVALANTDTNLPLRDRIEQVYAAAPPAQRAVLEPLRERARVAEAVSVQETMGLNRYLSRKGRQGQVNDDGSVVTFGITIDSQGNPTMGDVQRFKDIDTWRISEGVAVERPRTTAAARPARELQGEAGKRAGSALGIQPAAPKATPTATVGQAVTQATQSAVPSAAPAAPAAAAPRASAPVAAAPAASQGVVRGLENDLAILRDQLVREQAEMTAGTRTTFSPTLEPLLRMVRESEAVRRAQAGQQMRQTELERALTQARAQVSGMR